jgi:Cys-tRNA(Pro) deacylase
MSKEAKDFPVTPGIRVLRAAKVEYEAHKYTYEEHGGTGQCAEVLGIDEHRVIKTIVLKTDAGKPFIVLMHGDNEISQKEMARILKVKQTEPCTVDEAQKYSGYFCGGISPFGFRKQVPVYAQKTIFDLDWIVINGGARGFFVKIKPEILKTVAKAVPVDAEQ